VPICRRLEPDIPFDAKATESVALVVSEQRATAIHPVVPTLGRSYRSAPGVSIAKLATGVDATRPLASSDASLVGQFVDDDDGFAVDNRLVVLVDDRGVQPVAIAAEILDDLTLGGDRLADSDRPHELEVLRGR